MGSFFQFFITILVIQLFYAFGITLLSHSFQQFDLSGQYMQPYQNISMNVSGLTEQISGATSKQLNLPIVDMGALVFYSGNIIVDLMLNFFTAIPSMITILITGFTTFFSLDAWLSSQLKLFVYTLVTVLYFIYLLEFILSVRSRGSVI